MSFPQYSANFFMTDEHGGCCCGIQHLYQFPASPTSELLLGHYNWQTKIPKDAKRVVAKDRLRDVIKSHLGEFYDSVLEEYEDYSYSEDEGLPDNLEEMQKRGRVSRCIEVALTEDQTLVWRTTLEEMGFVEGINFLNDNSGNRVHIFLLDTLNLK